MEALATEYQALMGAFIVLSFFCLFLVWIIGVMVQDMFTKPKRNLKRLNYHREVDKLDGE
jgi:hypothetical protein